MALPKSRGGSVKGHECVMDIGALQKSTLSVSQLARPQPLCRALSWNRVRRKVLCLAAILCVGFLFSLAQGAPRSDEPDDISNGMADFLTEMSPGQRRLTSSSTCVDTMTLAEKQAYCASAAQAAEEVVEFPLLVVPTSQLEDTANPRLRDEYIGYIVLYIFVIFYMFVCIAIVCDEFFVPALECFVDSFGISMDVAGATFMAAGGSMPELFTSFISTFRGRNNPNMGQVGMATITGSAVFNVLFVIAICAIASTEVLTLTWWPLARDCSFYVVNLATVVIVFVYITPKEITAGEAAILFVEYLCYCTFMKFNGRIHNWVETKLLHHQACRDKGTEEGTEETQASRQSGMADATGTAVARFEKPSLFRKGIVQLLTQNAYLYETAGIAAVTQIKGSLEETFSQLDKDGDGYLSTPEVKDLLATLGCKHDRAAINTALRRITRTGEDKVSFENFKRWYIASEARIEIEVRRVFDRFDLDSNGFIDGIEIENVLRTLGHKPTEEDIAKFVDDIQKACPDSPRNSGDGVAKSSSKSSNDKEKQPSAATEDAPSQQAQRASQKGAITFDQFQVWYSKSLFYQGKQKQNELDLDAEENGYMTIEMPEEASWSALIWWAFTYPVCAMLYCTMPDVRKPNHSRNVVMAIIEFLLSLVWIGLFCLFLVEYLVVVCNTCRIPASVAAVTLLAAGTSIPDLLSSYIVARKGAGDMAVSSSIGSNIFDVTVGLPLPWLAYNFIFGESVTVESETAGFSVFVLLLMLVCVIGTVMFMKWKMTKTLGYIMMILYVLFILQDLIQNLPDREDPWVRPVRWGR